MGERKRILTEVGSVSRTKQAFKEDTDINAIMRKYLATGLLTHQARVEPRYGDFSSSVDYLTALNMIKDAQDRFMELPSKVRSYFQNDWGKLLDCVYDPSRRKEVEDLGLIPPSGVVAGGSLDEKKVENVVAEPPKS